MGRLGELPCGPGKFLDMSNASGLQPLGCRTTTTGAARRLCRSVAILAVAQLVQKNQLIERGARSCRSLPAMPRSRGCSWMVCGSPQDDMKLLRFETDASAKPERGGLQGEWRPMPRDGALVLSDLRNPTLSIICEPCGRRGTYGVERLMERHGDAKMTDLLQTLANCPKARSASIHDRCKVVFEQLLP
jgi:hypothetical protein